MSASIFICGCEDIDWVPDRGEAAQVALMVGGTTGTRTVYDASVNNFVWQTGDGLSVWAKSSSGTFVLDNQVFRLLAAGADGSSAYFSSTLGSLMDEGTYSYYVTYPLPESADGSKATFRLPAVQDGTASAGVDILLSEPVTGPRLAPIETGNPVGQDNLLKIRMKHLLHFLRFYIPEGCNLLGEPVRRIEFTMHRPIAGVVTVNVTDASSASLAEGVNVMTLELRNPIDESADGTESAVVGIFPPQTAYSAGDQMAVSIYSENKWASLNPMSLDGRTFSAGHMTPVPLRPVEVKQLYKLMFTLASNNLGEDPYNIKIALPEGVNWPGGTSNVLEFDGTHDGLIKIGDTFIVETKDENAFNALSSQPLTVSYESESALVTESLVLADLTSVSNAACSLNCPYLFFEDFSEVEYINSNDDYSMSSPGSKDPVTFLDGWSAARVGAQAGTAIRLACRRETSADYPARADSPALSGLKDGVTVSLEIDFDYSMDREGYATWPFSTPEISQTVHIGYITTSKALKSGDSTGDFPVDFTVNETTGSYTNINHNYNTVLTDVQYKTEAPLRLSLRTTPEHKAGTSNNTCWLYIDNIKVKIAK